MRSITCIRGPSSRIFSRELQRWTQRDQRAPERQARSVRPRTARRATSAQARAVRRAARSDRNQFASVNHGHPSVAATPRPGELTARAWFTQEGRRLPVPLGADSNEIRCQASYRRKRDAYGDQIPHGSQDRSHAEDRDQSRPPRMNLRRSQGKAGIETHDRTRTQDGIQGPDGNKIRDHARIET